MPAVNQDDDVLALAVGNIGDTLSSISVPDPRSVGYRPSD